MNELVWVESAKDLFKPSMISIVTSTRIYTLHFSLERRDEPKTETIRKTSFQVRKTKVAAIDKTTIEPMVVRDA